MNETAGRYGRAGEAAPVHSGTEEHRQEVRFHGTGAVNRRY